MTEKSAGSTPTTGDTTNVLTALSSNDGTLSLTVNIDRSTAKKLAWWAIALLIGATLVLGAVLFFLGMNYAALQENTKVTSREGRLLQAAEDERRLENRAAWKELGIDGYALEDHDISEILNELKRKHPAKEDE